MHRETTARGWLRNGNRPGNPESAPPCGARTRQGKLGRWRWAMGCRFVEADGNPLRPIAWLTFAVSLAGVPGCGGGESAPTPPAQFRGVWIGTLTPKSVLGGECVGAVLKGIVGSPARYAASFQQAGSNLTATITSARTGTTCWYAGDARSDSFSLHLSSCQVGVLAGIRCPNGAVRDIQLVSDEILGAVAGDAVSARHEELWNVFVGGTAVSVGMLTVNGESTTTRGPEQFD